MTDPKPAPRGDAAWRARKAEIDSRNDEARKQGAARRAAQDAKVAARRRAAEAFEDANLPVQPEP